MDNRQWRNHKSDNPDRYEHYVTLGDSGRAISYDGAKSIWWGPAPLPDRATIRGVVTEDGRDIGLLLRLHSGTLVQGNAGSVRSMPYYECPDCEGSGLRQPFDFLDFFCPLCHGFGLIRIGTHA